MALNCHLSHVISYSDYPQTKLCICFAAFYWFWIISQQLLRAKVWDLCSLFIMIHTHNLLSGFMVLPKLNGPHNLLSAVHSLCANLTFLFWAMTGLHGKQQMHKKTYKTRFSWKVFVFFKILFYFHFLFLCYAHCTCSADFFGLFSKREKGKVIWKSLLLQQCLMCRIIAWHLMKVICRLYVCSVNVKTRWKSKKDPSNRDGRLLDMLEPLLLCLWAHRDTHYTPCINLRLIINLLQLQQLFSLLFACYSKCFKCFNILI